MPPSKQPSFDAVGAYIAAFCDVSDCGGSHTWHNEGVKKWAPNQKISRKGPKPQRPAKKLKEFELASLCALAPLREAVGFFTASIPHICATRERGINRGLEFCLAMRHALEDV